MKLKWETSFEEALVRVGSLIELIRSGSLSIDGREIRSDAPAVLKMEIEASKKGVEIEFEIESKRGGEDDDSDREQQPSEQRTSPQTWHL